MKPYATPSFLLIIFCVFFISAVVLCSCTQATGDAVAPKVTVTTVAGTGEYGFTNGPANSATFGSPKGITIDKAGNIYICDFGTIRKITQTGNVETIGMVENPNALAFDNNGNLIIGTLGAIYIQNNNGVMVTLGTYRKINGMSFSNVDAIAIDKNGNVYAADYGKNAVYNISGKTVTTVGATPGAEITPGNKATPPYFENPTGIAIDSKGNIFVVESRKHQILKVSANNQVSVFAGSGNADSTDGVGMAAGFCFPQSIAIDKNDNIYVADQGNNKIRMITPGGLVTTLAGNGDYASDDGDGLSASFNQPTAVAVGKDGEVYVAETGGNKIRKITFDYDDYLQKSVQFVKVNNHHKKNTGNDNIEGQPDTTAYHLPYRDNTMETYGPDYIDTFSVSGVGFRFVHVDNRRKGLNRVTLERLTDGKWIRGVTFEPMRLQHDLHHSVDVNNDGFIDITRELRFTSEVYFFDPVAKDFLPASDDQLNADITLIDRKGNIFCDFQAYKGMCGQITSDLYTYKGFEKKVLFTMHFDNCERGVDIDSITRINIKQPGDSIVSVIKLKKPVSEFDIDKAFAYKAYWRQHYKKLLGYQ